MTPLLWPVWCAASRGSASSTTSDSPLGRCRSSAIAVAIPTIPPPITATSNFCATAARPSGFGGRFADRSRSEPAHQVAQARPRQRDDHSQGAYDPNPPRAAWEAGHVGDCASIPLFVLRAVVRLQHGRCQRPPCLEARLVWRARRSVPESGVRALVLKRLVTE